MNCGLGLHQFLARWQWAIIFGLGFLTILNNIFAFVFLLIPVIPGLGGTSYLVLSYNAGIFVAFLLLIYFKENQKKKMLDLNQ